MTRLSDASSLRDSQAAWMTESQKGALDQQAARRPSPPPQFHPTTTAAAAPADQGQASASAQTEARPVVKQQDFALAHSLPDQSFLPTGGVQAASHQQQHRQQDQTHDRQDYDVTFTDLQRMPQSTAPVAQQHQQHVDVPVSMNISSRESQQNELQPEEEQVNNGKAPPAAAESEQSGTTDEGGSRSMELTDVRTGHMRQPLQQQQQQLLSSPERLHQNDQNSSPANYSQSQSRTAEGYSQSQSDQTQLCETPELPPMAESTRDNRPQFGRERVFSLLLLVVLQY